MDMPPKKIKKKDKKELDPIDSWIEKGYSEAEFLNEVKPLIITEILVGIKKLKGTVNPLTILEKRYKACKTNKRCAEFGRIILALKDLKARMNKGDEIARMYLVNYGFVGIVKKLKTKEKIND
jgi:hypothetical protein